MELTSGSYEFIYLPEVAYIKYYGDDTTLGELAANEEVKKIVEEKLPMLMTQDVIERDGHKSLRELSFGPISPVTKEILKELDKKLKEVKVNIA